MAPTQENVEQIHFQKLDENTVILAEVDHNIKNDYVNKVDGDFDIRKYESIQFRSQFKWLDLAVQVALHAVSLYGVLCVVTNQPRFYTTLFAIATVYTTGFGITAGVHRLWSHRAYRARLPLRLLLAALFTVTGQRDIYTWALDHRVHHKYAETVADPHDINRGFLFAHVGWVVMTPHPAVENRRGALRTTSKDLLDDPVVRLQRKFYIPLFLLLNVVLPVAIPVYCWGETVFFSFVVSFVTRFTVTLNIAFCVNSFAHLWGNKPYDSFIKSVENKLVSVAALGEGWHNYHHTFPWDYRTSELGRLNPSTRLIDLFAKIGWAYDLKAATTAMVSRKSARSGDGSSKGH